VGVNANLQIVIGEQHRILKLKKCMGTVLGVVARGMATKRNDRKCRGIFIFIIPRLFKFNLSVQRSTFNV
jgi:hypothetical protein